VHVWNRYFSFALKRLFLPGFHGKCPGSTTSDESKVFGSSPGVHRR
jgi:hypothetical protein